MFGISGEHLVVLVVILLLFGPKRLPELGNTLGKAIKNFKDAVSGVQEAKFTKIEDHSNRPEFRAEGTSSADDAVSAGSTTGSSEKKTDKT